jgi:hypothetical protein
LTGYTSLPREETYLVTLRRLNNPNALPACMVKLIEDSGELKLPSTKTGFLL